MGKIFFDDNQFGRILLYSLKYALGRRTYIVSTTASYIVNCLPNITQETIDSLVKYMKDFSDSVVGKKEAFGDRCDEIEWVNLYNKISSVKNNVPKKKEVNLSNRDTSLMICSALRYGRNNNDICALQDSIRLVIPHLKEFQDNDLLLFYQDVSEPFYGTLIIGDDVVFYQQLLNEIVHRNLILSNHHLKIIGSWLSPMLDIPLNTTFIINNDDTKKYVLTDDGFDIVGNNNYYLNTPKDLLLNLLTKKYTVTLCDSCVNAKNKNKK